MQRLQRVKFVLTALSCLAVSGLFVLESPTAHGQTQAAMNLQAGHDFQKADGEMNAAYRKLMSVLTLSQRAQLKKSQSAWLKFRDAEGTFLSSKAEGGSVYPMVFSNDIAAITRERTRELKKTYTRFTTEGNM